jgi:hypothetical protein
MRKTIWTYGLISGAIDMIGLIMMTINSKKDIDYDHAEIYGYTFMAVSFIPVFLGMLKYRQQKGGGAFTYGNAFKAGILMTLIASGVYVLTWLVCFYGFIPDFAERYGQHMIDKMKTEGKPAAEIEETIRRMQSYKEMYKNPLVNIAMTFTEIFPIGLVFTLLFSLLLKRTAKTAQA